MYSYYVVEEERGKRGVKRVALGRLQERGKTEYMKIVPGEENNQLINARYTLSHISSLCLLKARGTAKLSPSMEVM